MMEFVQKKFTAAICAGILGLLVAAPMTGCTEEPPPEKRPLTQKELEQSLDRRGKFTQSALEAWNADKKKLEAQRKAFEEEQERRADQARRDYDELMEKERRQQMKPD